MWKAKEMELTKKKYYCQMDYPLGMEKHVWNWIWLGHAHTFGIIGWIFILWGNVPRSIMLIMFIYAQFAAAGTSMGAHRLWAHKTFKANLSLRIILAFAQTAAVQYPIFKWCRDHILHHKYLETDGDPHNAKRGMFFSHMGWLFVPEHPSIKEKERSIDMSDLDDDPVVRFQTKYYWFLVPIAVQFVPGSIMHYFYPGVTFFQLFCLNYAWYLASLHITWLVNSVAHHYGCRPYDKSLGASENLLISFLCGGEGFHNYHHTFPWDYKAAEFGHYGTNWICLVIDLMAKVGWAYDLKTMPSSVITKRILRTGDHELHSEINGDSQRFKEHEEQLEFGENKREGKKGQEYFG